MTPTPVQEAEELIIMDDMEVSKKPEIHIEENKEPDTTPLIDFGAEESTDSTTEEPVTNEVVSDAATSSTENSDLFNFDEISTPEVAEEVAVDAVEPVATDTGSADIFGGAANDDTAGEKNMDQILDGTIADLTTRLDEATHHVEEEIKLETDLAEKLSASQERKANGELEVSQIKKNITAIQKMKSSEMKNTHNSNRKKAA